MKNNTITIGLITAPGFTKKISEKLASSLPDLLEHYIDHHFQWKVHVESDPLTGWTDNPEELMEAIKKEKEQNKWDFSVCLTDLPFFRDNRLLIAESNQDEDVAFISLPGLGALPLKKRIRTTILQLINDMYYGSAEHTEKGSRIKYTNQQIQEKWIRFFEPVQKKVGDHESEMGITLTVKSRLRGTIRIITGMVRANRPWSLFPSFIKIMVIAFTTGVYAMVFPTLWMLSNHYQLWRLLILSFGSISILITWIIVAHNLWEKTNSNLNNYIRKLYNCTTILTLLTTVVIYYIILYGLFLLAVTFMLPESLLQSQLSAKVTVSSYFYIAWVATSLSTVIGALGSTLEKEEVVLTGTYGYRQRQRYKLMKEAEEESDSSYK